MKKKKKKRKVKKFTGYEKIFLGHFYAEVHAIEEKNKTTPTKRASKCDIDLPNLCRYKRENPNARLISALRLVKPMGHSLGELIMSAEHAADEWQKGEDERKKKGKGI